MDVRFGTPELSTLDDQAGEVLVLPLYSDIRPLPGMLGLVDWRLCGEISQLVWQEFLDGNLSQTLILPTRGRLPVHKLLLFGLGRSECMDIVRFDEAIRTILSILADLQVRSFAAELPGRHNDQIGATLAMTHFIGEASRVTSLEEVLILDVPEAQRRMGHVVDGEKRRARADAAR